MMEIQPIRNESDYDATLAEIERLMDAAPGSPDAERLDVLVTLVEAYEAKAHPMPTLEPMDILLGHLENGRSG